MLESLAQAYEKCFGQALMDYNAAQKRKDEDAKDVFFQAIMSVYMDSKKTAREKYTPKKYRKHKDKE